MNFTSNFATNSILTLLSAKNNIKIELSVKFYPKFWYPKLKSVHANDLLVSVHEFYLKFRNKFDFDVTFIEK